jgi:branched-chain amino acid transport system substrate-binding protein
MPARARSTGQVGDNLYNRGLSELRADRRRHSHAAQEITGKKVITGEDMRMGLRTSTCPKPALKEIGLEGFMPRR